MFVALVLVSGCSIIGGLIPLQPQINCEEEIAKLPQIIEENQGRIFTVMKILDGDTVQLVNGDKVRFVGINTPEKGLKWSAEAAQLTTKLSENGIMLARDVEDKDQYGRLLRYAFTEDKFINAELVRQGLATIYPVEPNTKYSTLFSCLEQEAKKNKRGLWSSTANYNIKLEVSYDAPGNDNENLNGEFVIIKNEDARTINIDKWSIKDQATHFYYFKNISLEPNMQIILYTGSGIDTKTELYWNSKEPIWNNAGDTAFLFDENGDLVTLISFP
ncbi:MAG: thermonuclease family protein [Candidatus Nanoarchaeia archaeon]